MASKAIWIDDIILFDAYMLDIWKDHLDSFYDYNEK